MRRSIVFIAALFIRTILNAGTYETVTSTAAQYTVPLVISSGAASSPIQNGVYCEMLPKVLAKVTFSAGTPSAVYSIGVSSVTDLGNGLTRINFLRSFSTGNYYVLATPQDNSSGSYCSYDEATDSASSVDIFCRNADTLAASDFNFMVIVFGKQ